jgi:hypothetical protein
MSKSKQYALITALKLTRRKASIISRISLILPPSRRGLMTASKKGGRGYKGRTASLPLKA